MKYVVLLLIVMAITAYLLHKGYAQLNYCVAVGNTVCSEVEK